MRLQLQAGNLLFTRIAEGGKEKTYPDSRIIGIRFLQQVRQDR